MIDKAVDRLADLYDLIWKPLFWLLVIIDIIWFILFFTNNLIIFYSFFVFIWLQIRLSIILDKKSKQKAIISFMPDKPEKDGIRYLRGKRAKEYEIAREKANIYLEISKFNKFFLNIRLFLMRLTGLHMYYFHNRHRYNASDRRLMDLFAISCFEQDCKKDPPVKYKTMHKLRIKYIMFKYRKERKRKEYWIRVWGKTNRLVYAWHEDFEKYKKLYWKRKRSNKLS